MNSEKIQTSTSTQLYYQPDNGILNIRFQGFLKSEEIAKDRLIFNETIRRKKIQLILMNQQDIKVLSKDVQSFIMRNTPELVNNGIKKMAIVLPENVFALAGISKIRNEAKTAEIQVETFSSEEAGIRWLLTNQPV